MSENEVTVDLSGPITLNLESVSDDLVAVGWHHVEVERAEAKLTNKKKLPSIFVMARIVNEDDPDHNRTVIWNSTLEGESLKFAKRFLNAVGLAGELNYNSYQDMADDLIGRECEVKIRHETYEGETSAKANQWRSVEFDLDVDFADL